MNHNEFNVNFLNQIYFLYEFPTRYFFYFFTHSRKFALKSLSMKRIWNEKKLKIKKSLQIKFDLD